MFVSIAVAMFSASPSFAQVDPVGAFNRHIAANWKGEYVRVGNYQVKGSPYLLGESFWGTIDYKDGKTVKGIKVIYDLLNQVAGIDLRKNNEIFEAEQGIEKFTIDLTENYGGNTLVFVNSQVYGLDKGYVNLLVDGERVALLKDYKVKIVSDPTNLMDKNIKVFDQYFEYYILDKATRRLEKIKLKEKEILSSVKADDASKAFIASNNLDIKKEKDLIKFITGYNNNFKSGNN